jgi:hypothetical protein
MKLLDLLRSALAAIATLDDNVALALLEEIRALVSWLGFAEHKELVANLAPEVASAVHVAGFAIGMPADRNECIQVIVASEKAFDCVPESVDDFVVAVLQHLLSETAGLVRRLLTLMHREDCAINDVLLFKEAIQELNDFERHPAAVTTERYERAAAGTLSDDEICKLSDVELSRLAFHAGQQFLVGKAKRRPTKRHINEVCDAFEPAAKRPDTHEKF